MAVELDKQSKGEFQDSLLRTQALKQHIGKEIPIRGSIKGGLWNHQLDKYAKGAALPNYTQAVPIDHLEFGGSFPQCRIVNYSRSEEEGTHWVAIYFPHRHLGIYIDSYGLAPDSLTFRLGDETPLRNALAKVTGRVIYNNVQLQDPNTAVCRYYCIYFLHKLSEKLKDHTSQPLALQYLQLLRN